jgi:hypothetical protein
LEETVAGVSTVEELGIAEDGSAIVVGEDAGRGGSGGDDERSEAPCGGVAGNFPCVVRKGLLLDMVSYQAGVSVVYM